MSLRASGVGRRASGLILALLGCAHPVAPHTASPKEGLSIAVYAHGDTGYSVIDDRRWVVTDGKTLELAHIDFDAALASLVIEPVAGAGQRALHVGRCERARMPELLQQHQVELRPRPEAPGQIEAHPVDPKPSGRFVEDVHCSVTGAPGRYLVRVLYVTTLKYRAQHDISVSAPDRATVSSRYAIKVPAWGERADVVLYDGTPGGDHPPRAVAHGEVALDGSTAVLSQAPHVVAAQLRRIYEGVVPTRDANINDAAWGRDAGPAVWVWLELPHLALAPGPLRVHLELAGEDTRDLDVPAEARRDDDRELRLPLWVDDHLRGMRQRYGDYSEGAQLAERLLLSIANTGDVSREVWIEEPLRPAHHHQLERTLPRTLTASGDRVRAKVVVAPGKIERVGFTVAYEF